MKHGHSSLVLCVSRDTKVLGSCTRATVLWHRTTPRWFSPPTLGRLISSLGESRQLPRLLHGVETCPRAPEARIFCIASPSRDGKTRRERARGRFASSCFESFAPFDTPYALAQGSHACDQRHACHRHRRAASKMDLVCRVAQRFGMRWIDAGGDRPRGSSTPVEIWARVRVSNKKSVERRLWWLPMIPSG